MIKLADERATDKQVAFITRLAQERELETADLERLLWKLAEHNANIDVKYFEFTKATASAAITWLIKRPLRTGYVKDHFEAMPKAEIGLRPGSEANFRRAEAAKLSSCSGYSPPPDTHYRDEFEKLHPKHDVFGGPHDVQDNLPGEDYASRPPQRTEPLPTHGVFRKDDQVYIIVASKRNPGRHYAKRMVETPERLTSSGTVVNFDYVTDQGAIWNLYEADRMPVADIQALLVEHRMCIYPGCYRVLRAAKSVSAGVGKRHAERLGIPWGKKA